LFFLRLGKVFMSKSAEAGLRDREKLKNFIHSEITKLFSSVLDYTEVAVDGKERYMNLRSKILKVGNDSIREIKKELDTRYNVKYDPPSEDVIIVDKTRVGR